MHVEWLSTRCILCLEERPLTRSHVIPEAVGGQLWSDFECRDCNAALGSSIEANLKLDPSVRLAIEALAPRVPRLASTMRRRAPFVARDGDLVIHGRWANGTFHVVPTPQPGGSIVKDQRGASQEIRRQLAKRGAAEAEIRAAIEAWRSAPPGQGISLGRGIGIRNGSVSDFAPDLRFADRANDECLLLIAYRFLALAIGRLIYSAALDGVRATLRTGRGNGWQAEPGILRAPYEGVHGLALVAAEPHVVVRVCLVRQLAWDVAFTDVRLNTLPEARAYQVCFEGEVQEQVA